jgi:hypothetical protein
MGRMPWQGTLRRLYEVACFDCDSAQILEATTVAEAKKEARQQYDWSLGRDKKWRCAECRPRRFGERL